MEFTIYHGDAMAKYIQQIEDFVPSVQHGTMASNQVRDHNYPYVIDNGAYSAYKTGEEWDRDAFLSRLERAKDIDNDPDAVVLPDVVGDSEKSFERSRRWVNKISFPLYFAVQDGMEVSDVRSFVEKFDLKGLFIGGTREWKHRTLGTWVNLAQDMGVKVHVGRPGNIPKCYRMGVDSVDTTYFVRWGIRPGEKQLLRDLEKSFSKHNSASKANW